MINHKILIVGAWMLILPGSLAKPFHAPSGQKLFVLLVDGVRHDYITRDLNKLPAFQRLLKEGVHVDGGVIPSFISTSVPNYQTIATGVHVESHGLLDNNPKYWDPDWTQRAKPIWTTALKTGLNVAAFNWIDACVPIDGTQPEPCVPYSSDISICNDEDVEANYELLIDSAVDQLAVADLVLFYYETVDKCGHDPGPDSPEVYEAMQYLDGHLEYLMNSLESQGIDQEVNIMMVSDHGMRQNVGKVSVVPPEVVERLGGYMDPGKEVLWHESSLEIWANKEVNGAVDAIYNEIKSLNLENVQVYKKPDVPAKYHFKHNQHIGDIILISERGQIISWGKDDYTGYAPGNHGWFADEDKDMWGIMAAKGPAFKQGYRQSEPIRMVDHYQVMAKILGIVPRPHEGYWSHVKSLLV